jgi:5-methylcytosine-specific restriction endonuclease McrA
MLRACPYCGRVHGRSHDCGHKPERTARAKSGSRREDRFRWCAAWKRKRSEIVERDGYLCQSCFHGLPPEGKGITTAGLEVHHIDSLKGNWRARLDSRNLITLCSSCHELAEDGGLAADDLRRIARANDRWQEGGGCDIPPAFDII